MEAKSAMKRNKIAMVGILCGDHSLILNKCSERELISEREYNNLKSINRENVEGHVVELVDKIMNKGEETCADFLTLLQTDGDIQSTFPGLRNVPWNYSSRLSQPVQACSELGRDFASQDCKRRKQDAPYPLNSRPTGLCVIINNENFPAQTQRCGTNRDAHSLAEVFSWLGFRVLMCKDQTQDQMGRALACFASLGGLPQLQEFGVKEWSGGAFADLRDAPKHGDAFVCCILSHGGKDGVSGIDGKPLSVKEILRTFNATSQSSLTGKPKVFLIQACRGGKMQPGVFLEHLQTDSEPLCIPVEADFLVAFATVEDYASVRHRTDGTWFIQSVCEQLREGCPRGDELNAILQRVNYDVSQREASSQPGAAKQMPEVRHTLRMSLVLSPNSN